MIELLTEQDLSLFLFQYLRACLVLLVDTKLAWLGTRGFRANRLYTRTLLLHVQMHAELFLAIDCNPLQSMAKPLEPSFL